MRVSLILISICAAIVVLITPTTQAAEPYKNTTWESLVPKDWDPAKEFKSLNLGAMQDSDPRAMDALSKMKDTWGNAPTERSMDGARIKISGFAIPLEMKGDKVTEFLLVPYFGACIHTPPPPANQIVHVISKKPIDAMRTMDAVTVSGTMGLNRAESPWGTSGYRLAVDKVEPYKLPDGK
ncbi:MAG: DUF3299 domain-containing protein [Rhodocyclaceae bacterium]|nr:DUF3299 domain-containing protein [Rhodocyclaceae bacterium]